MASRKAVSVARPIAPVKPAPAAKPRAGTAPLFTHGAAVRLRGLSSPGRLAVGTSKVAQYLASRGTPALLRGAGMLLKLVHNEQKHDDAGKKLTQSEKAVHIPPSEGQAKSNTGQVAAVDARPAPPVDEKAARRTLQDSLQANAPRTIEDVDNFKQDMKAQQMSADVLTVVQGDKNAVTTTFGDIRKTPTPTPAEGKPEALPPPEIAPPTPVLNLGVGTIAPLQKEHTDTSTYTKEADSKLVEEGITQEQLDMVDSGDLAQANREKKGLEKAARTEPLAVQAFARQQSGKVDRELQHEERSDRDRAKAKRRAGLDATAKKQKDTRSAFEKKRDEVAARINGIYKTAQDSVKKKLADLETRSLKRFDEGNTAAARAFEENVNREIDAFKDRRYSGLGKLNKVRDWVLGIDDLPPVKRIFDRNRAAFVRTIDRLVENITADNQRVIQECKAELARARKDIEAFVSKLGPELQGIGQTAAKEMSAKLDEMDQFVANKGQELQNKLKDKQTAAIKAIDEKIEKMKEEMSGALAKLGKLLLWAAKKFFTWALEQLGYSLSEIESIISRGAAVLKAIFTKPIVFVKNLVKAASAGFENFAKNFLTHLKDAIFDWLTGSLEGVQLPTSWDLPGIASVALQMIGLTWANIRAKLVVAIGENTVKAMETGFDLVVTLVKNGPMAAWEKIQEMGAEIKEAFIEGVKDFIKIKIIQKAVETVIALFIPGAGIVRAIIAIYDTIVFFIKKAKQIAEMVGNFLGSIGEIAMGNIGAGADALEKGLATALKLVINFLARFLRLDGITAKIRAAIQKLRAKVDNILDRIVAWIVTKAKKAFAAVARGAQNLKGRVLEWWKARKSFSAQDGRHALFFQGQGAAAVLTVATTPTPVTPFLRSVRAAATAHTDPAVRAAYLNAVQLARAVDALRAQVESGPNPRQPADIDNLNLQMERLAVVLPPLITLAFPPAATPAGSAHVAVGQLIKLVRSDLVALVTKVGPSPVPNVPLVNFRVVSPRQERSRATLATGFLNTAFGSEFTRYTADPRALYLGGNPDKNSAVGKAVKARMIKEGKLVNNKVLYARDGRWYDLASCEMGHIIDAVTWWNSNGRLTGARSPTVIAFMNDPDNYEFEPSGPNQARGAALAARGIHYEPPAI